MTKPKLKTGGIYLCRHRRKGAFVIKLHTYTDDWYTAYMVEGETNAILPENIKVAGDQIRLRASLCTLEEYPAKPVRNRGGRRT